MPPWHRFRIAAAALLLALPAVGAAAAPAPASVRLPGHVLPALARAERQAADAATADDLLTLTIVLARDDQAGFDAYLRRVYDPRAPEYRRFLGQRAIADRFGPSRARYHRVRRWLRAQGFVLVQESTNRLTVTATASRVVVERTFDVRIDRYRLGAHTFFANDRDPAVPASLAATVLAVGGFSNLARPHAAGEAIRDFLDPIRRCVKDILKREPGTTEAQAKARCTGQSTTGGNNGSGGGGGGSSLVAHAGGPRNGVPLDWLHVDGTGETVGLVAFDTFALADIADYIALAGLPPSTLARVSQVHVNGGASLGPDELEVILDVVAVLAGAPGASIAVYDAPFTGLGSFQAVFNAMLDDGVDIISNSWAYCEDQTTLADVQSIDAIFQNAAMAQVSVFNAAGDSGSTCLNGSPNTLAVPASSPNATAVGGTTLAVGPALIYDGETYWDGTADVPPTGRGGFGPSRFFARPSFQNGFTPSPMRSVPDVAANADPATGLVICQANAGGCPTGLFYGGTSVAAPHWAAFTALLNQAQGTNLGFLNPLLYPLAGTNALHSAAEIGSDFAHVGLGSPNLSVLHRALAGKALGPVDAQKSQVDISGDALADGSTPLAIVVRLRDASGHTVDGKTVTLSADPATNVVITPPSGVSNVANGAVVFGVTTLAPETVTFTATDASDGIVLQKTAVVPFEVPPAASGGIQAFPTTVPANGTSTTTITVTLQDGLGRPAPGKEIRLTQGSGHSVITGPTPPVTDAAGQIQFTATNRVNEVVTYGAVDVTDGDLPVPGSVQVTYDGASTSCVGPTPVGQNGYVVTSFATGFVAESFFFANVNWGGCPGASNPAFRGEDVFIADFRTGEIYRFGVAGGAVSSANVLATLGQTFGYPAIGKDGKLYATFGSTGVSGTTGSVVEVDPTSGALVRTLASNQTCPSGLAVDPLSGDLFFTHQCFGSGLNDATITRIRNPGGMTPTVETYATLPLSPNGQLAFAPNGTLYAPTGYTTPNPPVIRIGGTDTPAPPTQTTLTGVSSIFTITVGAVDANGEATALLDLTLDGLQLYDLTTDPPTATVIATNMGSGIIGPDGCMYAGISDTVHKLTRADGTCDFVPSSALPSLTLAPATVAPDPAQGTAQSFTATFRTLDLPAGTPVVFQVTGANSEGRLVRTNAAGEAVFSYVAARAGTDTVVASATVGGEDLVSNEATITWTAGRHTTFMTLNPSPTGGIPGLPSVLTAALVDVSAEPPVPVAGQTITFARGAATCTATTDAAGLATCVLLADTTGLAPLTATFAGTPGLLPATATIGFNVTGGVAPSPFTVYASKPKGKLVKFGPVVLADELEPAGVGYDVQKLDSLAAPAGTNGGLSPDPDTHLTSYAVKRAKGAPKFVKTTDVRLLNPCSHAVLTLGKPASLLVPTAKDLMAPPVPPTDADHEVDHFLCYKAKAQKKRADGTPVPALRKGLQVEVEDQFQTTRYDLGKVVLACNPVAKSGDPVQLGGPAKGAPFPITPAAIRNPASHLLCYRAKIATKRIEQAGCGPATPGDKGTKIVPKQAKHMPRLGVHLANQFGAPDVDTKKATLVCLPSVLGP